MNVPSSSAHLFSFLDALRLGRYPRCSLLTVLVIGVGSGSAQADVTYSDGTWGAPWSLAAQFILGPGASTQAATTTASGGNPGAYYRQMTTLPTAGAGTRNGIESEYLFSGASGVNGYNPSMQGAILSLDFSIDIINISNTPGAAVDAAPMLQQGGNFYRANLLLTFSTSWTTLSQTGYTAASFGLLSNDPSGTGSLINFSMNPDFGPTGGAISFGLGSGHSTNLGGGGNSVIEGFDNWTITLHTAAVPEPASLTLVLVGGLAITLWARRRPT
jgi:hypothetical protein